MSNRSYVFYISKTGRFAVAEREFWLANHRLDDRSDAALITRMTGLGFAEVMENQFEYQGDGDAVDTLIQNGFERVKR